MGFSPTSKVSGDWCSSATASPRPELKYDDYAGLDVAGKIVVMIRRTPRATATGDQRFDKSVPVGEDSNHAVVRRPRSRTRRLTRPRASSSSTTRRRPARATRSRSTPITPSALPRPNSRCCSSSERRSTPPIAGGPIKSIADIETLIDKDLKPRSFEIKDWKIDAEVTVNRTDFKVKNVVGVLEGNGPLADETIVIGAHYDHVGYGNFGSLGGQGREGQDPLRGRRQRQRHHRPHRTRPPLRRDEGPPGSADRVHRLHRGGTRAVRLDPLLQGAAVPAREDGRDAQHGHDRPHEAGDRPTGSASGRRRTGSWSTAPAPRTAFSRARR